MTGITYTFATQTGPIPLSELDTNFALMTNGTLNASFATVTATTPIGTSSQVGAFNYGTLSYNDVNVVFSAQGSTNSYFQKIIQNTSSGTAASTDYVVSNNLGTASTYYGNFGINSSTYAGTGAYNLPNAVYVSATSGDLALGTTTANGIHFFVNNGATDALAISAAGVVSTTTPATSDSSTTLATTAFVKSVGPNFSNAGITIAANTTLTLANLGAWGTFSGAGWTVTLPAVATVANGLTWTQLGGSAGGTLKANGAELITRDGVAANSFAIGPGEYVTVTSNGATSWNVTSDGMSSTAIANAIPGRNKIINGGMRIAQRGTSYSLTNGFAYGSIDRWNVSQVTSAAGRFYQLPLSTPSLAGGCQYMASLGRNSGSSLTNALFMQTALESINSIPMAGKIVCLSFYAYAGANFSAVGNLLNINVGSGTGTDQSASTLGSWTGNTYPITTSQALTTSLTRYSFTGTIPVNSTQTYLQLSYIPTGTSGADDNLYITGIQLEVVPSLTSPPTQFEILDYGVELNICKRYFEMSYDIGVLPGTATTSGMAETYISGPSGFNGALIPANFKVNKRTAPTMTFYSPATGASGKIRDAVNSADVTATGTTNGTTSASVSGVMGTGNNYVNMQMHWTANAEL